MKGKSRLVRFYAHELMQMERLTNLEIALGLIGSTLIMVSSTWGFLYLLNASGNCYEINPGE